MKVGWVLFAKPPLPGFVKTRLAKTTSEEFALSLYRLILQWQFENIEALAKFSRGAGIKSSYYLYTATPGSLSSAKKLFKELPHSSKFKYRMQSPGSLGEKMKNAFIEVLNKNDRVVIWGADIPLLHLEHFAGVINSSASGGCIIPATDGGYCLLTIDKASFKPAIFDNIRWSHRKTLRDQAAAFQREGVDLKQLSPVPDLDTGRDILSNLIYMQRNDNEVYQQRAFELNELLKAQTELILT